MCFVHVSSKNILSFDYNLFVLLYCNNLKVSNKPLKYKAMVKTKYTLSPSSQLQDNDNIAQ